MKRNNNKQQVTNGGLGLTTIVFLIFLVFKLAGIGIVATWSWWWVFSPIWISLLVGLSFIVISALIIFIAVLIDDYKRKKARKKRLNEKNR